MANNRVFLKSKSDHNKQLTLFKYYPSTGWYLYATKEDINEWLDEYINDGSQWGNIDFEFIFESIEDEIVREKRNIIEEIKEIIPKK